VIIKEEVKKGKKGEAAKVVEAVKRKKVTDVVVPYLIPSHG
jgi:hypothetical protein